MRSLVLFLGALAVGLVLVLGSSGAAGGRAPSFSTPVVIGYPEGDDWEPDVAADGRGNVYVAWAHFGEVPGCDTCSSPAALFQASHDGGTTWSAPRPLNPHPRGAGDTYQIDLQVAVNDAGVVFVAYMDSKDTVVQRSDDFGETFGGQVVVNVGVKKSWTDKVGLAVQDDDVYVAFSIAQRFFVSASHDGGRTFATTQINSKSSTFGWTLTSGGAVDSKGVVYFSWVGVHQSGNALGPQDLFVTKSVDGGRTWTVSMIEKGIPPGPDCSEFFCAWDFWGPQAVLSIDDADTVYVAYNAGVERRGPPAVWFRASRDGGATWTDRVPVHADGLGDAIHLFPAIEGGAAGRVHVSWMDNRLGKFNTWYRSSTDGGATWSSEIRVNDDLGYPYQTEDGFDFTYGDYYGIALDAKGKVHLAWGEAPDYVGPGNVWYAHS